MYYPDNGAVTSYHSIGNSESHCLNVQKEAKGHDLWVWSSNGCRDWQRSQWTFLANNHIQTHISDFLYMDLDQLGEKNGHLWECANTDNQLFSFPGIVFDTCN